MIVDGTVVGGTAALAFHGSAGSTAGADVITVICHENPAITTTVGADGRFVSLNPSGDSRFLIDGHTMVARPGQTAIREGNSARTVNDVTVGRRVHVKGTWLPAEATAQPVLASEIKLQDGDDSSALSCVAGAKAEVEGEITAKSTTSTTAITVSQQGKGLFECAVSASTSIRKGNKSYAFAELGLGWQVHVKGMAQGLSATGACKVTASEAMVQRD